MLIHSKVFFQSISFKAVRCEISHNVFPVFVVSFIGISFTVSFSTMGYFSLRSNIGKISRLIPLSTLTGSLSRWYIEFDISVSLFMTLEVFLSYYISRMKNYVENEYPRSTNNSTKYCYITIKNLVIMISLYLLNFRKYVC